jgi:hypothetical protein
MFSRALLLFLLIFLPGITLSAAAIWFGIRGTLKLGLIQLAGIALPGYLLFWLYLGAPKTSYAISVALPFIFAACLLLLLIRFTPAQRKRLLPLLTPAALTFFAALGVLSFGFLYGGKTTPMETAQTRFSHTLPPDNMMPLLLADGLHHGAVPRPLLGDWLSSDRPPLQTALILALEPVVKDWPMDYEIASVILQCLWIFATWLLLRAFRISQLSTALVILTIYLTGFALVNSFFVWPKLLAAVYTLAFAIPILALLRGNFRRRSWLLRILSAFLLACGLLSHGGTLFSVLGIGLFMLAGLRLSLIRESCLIGLIALAFYAPWIGYQKFIDPPGDRLLKWHLAGMEKPNNIPAFEAIRAAYQRQKFSDWTHAKESNFWTLFGNESKFAEQFGFSRKALRELRVVQFFYLVPSIGFVSLGAIGLLYWRKNKELAAARRLFACFLLSALVNILMLFEQSATTIQSLSYIMVLMAMAACILALRGALPRVAIAVCLLQCVWSWTVYEPDLRTLTIPSFRPVPIIGSMLALHILSLAGLSLLLFAPFKRLYRWGTRN